jgi:hypothetical protein
MRAGPAPAFGSDSVGEMGLQQSACMLCNVSDLEVWSGVENNFGLTSSCQHKNLGDIMLLHL